MTFLESEIDKVPRLNNVVRGQGEELGTLKKNANMLRDDVQQMEHKLFVLQSGTLP